MIRVENLQKHFGLTRAVDDISFAVEKGEVVGFLGPNGAGKTTTIRVLTCYHPATAGTATVAGHDVFEHPVEVRRQIGYLPENVPIYPDLRVEEYLHYRAALKGVPRRERKAAVGQAMERCGVTEVRRKLVGHISRGYRQRVGLAEALVAQPPILILDEPTTGLDPNQRLKVRNMVRELAAEHTILFSSHILSEVEDVSSRILIIHHGKIRADGAPRELLEQSGARRLVVAARLPGKDLLACLQSLPGTDKLEVTGEADGFATVTAAVAPKADPRDEAYRALERTGAAIRELRLDLATLEQFFYDRTREDQPVVSP
jgi:ABC-2 type transport system ATP-binding protein